MDNPENSGGGSSEFPKPGNPFVESGYKESPDNVTPQQPVAEPDKNAMNAWQKKLVGILQPKSSTPAPEVPSNGQTEIAGPSQDVFDTQKRVQEGQERIQNRRKAF